MKIHKSLLKAFYKCILGVFLALAFSSCNKSKQIESIIPKEADFVAVVNLKSLYMKGELGKLNELNFYKVIEEEIQNEDKRIANFLQTIMQDPTSTGLQLTSDVYIFGEQTQSPYSRFGISLKISDEGDFQEFVQNSLQIFGDLGGGNLEIDNRGKLNGVDFKDENMALVWDKNKCLLYMGMGRDDLNPILEDALHLFKMEPQKTMVENKSFEKFLKRKSDIGCWVSLEAYANDLIDFSGERDYFAYEDSFAYLYLNFEKENVVLNYVFEPNETIHKQLKNADVWEKGVDKKLLQFFPQDNIVFVSASINPENLQKSFKKQQNNLEWNEKFQENLDVSFDDFIGSLEGDLFLSVYKNNATQTSNSLPSNSFNFRLALNLKNKNVLEKILNAKLPPNWQHSGSMYSNSQNGAGTFINLSDEYFIIGNDPNSVQNMSSSGFGANSFANSTYEKQVQKEPVFGFVSLDLKEFPADFQNNIISNYPPPVSQMIQKTDEQLDFIELNYVDTYEAEVRLKTNEKDENSLLTLIHLIDDNYGLFTSY